QQMTKKMEVLSQLSINLDRLKENIIALSAIGKAENGGIYRMGFSREDYHARLWLLEKMKAMGLDASMDGALNVVGKLAPKKSTKPSIVVGSHIDTVPNAGALDGALGVLAGLECLHVIQENNLSINYPIELIAFSDEEGRFGGMFGSRSFAGWMNPGYLEEATDLDGVRLREAMEDLGH